MATGDTYGCQACKAYFEGACQLFVDAAAKALDSAGVGAADVDTVVTISSTGIATPSLEARARHVATGLSQLLVAPIAVALEQRVDARLLTAFGFGLFALGLALSGSQTPETDFDAMFWPQIIRGAAIMFCLLPPTRLALGRLDACRVPDASGLFNLMRNLGGAIGLAMIDTVIYCRSPVLGAAIMTIQAGDIETAKFIGIPLALFAARPTGRSMRNSAMLQPFVEKAAMVRAINEAWMMIAALTVAALLCVPFAKKPSLAPARASRRKNAAATL